MKYLESDVMWYKWQQTLLLPTWLGYDITQCGSICWFLSQVQNLRDNNRNLGLDVSTLAHTCDRLSDELQTSQEDSTFWENQYATKNGEVGGNQGTLMAPDPSILSLPSLCPFPPPFPSLLPPSSLVEGGMQVTILSTQSTGSSIQRP